MMVIDPIFGSIQLDDRGQALLETDSVRREQQRLEQIKCLGFISTVFPSATHSMWEHHLGMYWLASQLTGLNATDRETLRGLCLLGGMGHLPFSRATEEAVWVAGTLSRSFAKKFLARYCQPVLDSCRTYNETFSARNSYQLVFGQGDSRAIHAWLSAYKLKSLSDGADLGHRDRVVCCRVLAENTLNSLYRILSRIDYIQRDLHYTGLARFSIAPGAILQRFDGTVESLRRTPEFNLVEELRRYLSDTLYLNPQALAIEACFSKQLTWALLRERITVENLLRWGDSKLEEEVNKVSPSSQLDSLRYSHYYPVSHSLTRLPARRASILDIERDILGFPRNPASLTKRILSYPSQSSEVVVAKLHFDQRTGATEANTFVLVTADCSQLSPVVKAVANVAKVAGSLDSALKWKQLGQDLVSHVLQAKRLIVNDEGLAEVLARAIQPSFEEFAKRFHQAFREALYRLDEDELIFVLEREMVRIPAKGPPPALVSGVLKSLVNRHPRRLKSRHRRQLLQFLKTAVVNAYRARQVEQAVAIETVAFLNEVLRNTGKQVAWVFPSVTLDQSRGPQEVDLISLSLARNAVTLTLAECTKSNSSTKALEDMQKLQRICSQARRFRDLRVEPQVLGPSKIGRRFVHLRPLA